jgi:hypothetical protein
MPLFTASLAVLVLYLGLDMGIIICPKPISSISLKQSGSTNLLHTSISVKFHNVHNA